MTMLLTHMVLLGNLSGRRASSSPNDGLGMFLIFVLLFPLLIIGAVVGYVMLTEVRTEYTVPAKVYAADLRTSGKQRNMVHVSVVAPNGVRSVHNTGYSAHNCPLIQYDAPVTLKVVIAAANWGENRHRHTYVELIGLTPCRSKA